MAIETFKKQTVMPLQMQSLPFVGWEPLVMETAQEPVAIRCEDSV